MNFSVTLFTPDRNITNAVWELKTDGISLEQPLLKALPPLDFLHEISAYTKDATPLIVFLGALFNLLKSPKNKNPSTTTISVNCAENSTNVIQFIDANKGDINVVINKAGGDREENGKN